MSHRGGAERQCERHKDEHEIPNGSCLKVECHFRSSFLVYSITHPAAETIEESAAPESHPRLSRAARAPCRSAFPPGDRSASQIERLQESRAYCVPYTSISVHATHDGLAVVLIFT